jgi:hypothetical protein
MILTSLGIFMGGFSNLDSLPYHQVGLCLSLARDRSWVKRKTGHGRPVSLLAPWGSAYLNGKQATIFMFPTSTLPSRTTRLG